MKKLMSLSSAAATYAAKTPMQIASTSNWKNACCGGEIAEVFECVVMTSASEDRNASVKST